MTGIYSGIGGPNTFRAVGMAVADFGGTVLGRPIEVVTANHQNKPDVGSAIAREEIDEKGVAAITLGGAPSVGLVAQTLAGEAGAVVEQGGDTRYRIAPDHVFGHALATDSTAAVEEADGKVLGETVYPLDTPDMTSALLSAQGFGDKVFGLANTETDLETTIKQAREFGPPDPLAAMLVHVSNVEALGLDTAQNIRTATSFYWGLNDQTRAFGERMTASNGGHVPTMGHAGAYSAITHYLEAVAAAGTTDAATVTTKMKDLPITDGFFENASIHENGRIVYDMLLAEVVAPEQSTGPADLCDIVARVPGKDLFLPAEESGCPLTAAKSN